MAIVGNENCWAKKFVTKSDNINEMNHTRGVDSPCVIIQIQKWETDSEMKNDLD